MGKIEYSVLHPEPSFATVWKGSQRVATLKTLARGEYELDEEDHRVWALSKKLNGEMRPFSMKSTLTSHSSATEEPPFKIKDQIFQYKGNFYSIGVVRPEGSVFATGQSSGPKFVCRLVNFPFSTLDEVNEETTAHLKKNRGVLAGKIYGMGTSGFHLELYEDDLDPIGPILAATTYVMYTTR